MRIQSYYFSETSHGRKIGHHPYRIHFENQEIRLALMEFCRNNYGVRYDYKRWSDWEILERMFNENLEPIVENTSLTEEDLDELCESMNKDGRKVKDEYQKMRRLEKKGHRYSSDGRDAKERAERIKEKIREWEKKKERQIDIILGTIGIVQSQRFSSEQVDRDVLGEAQGSRPKKSEHVADRIEALEEKIYGEKDSEEVD